MFDGFKGFFIPKKIEQSVKQETQSFGLETYTVPSADWVAASGTINLPSSGKWLVLVNCNIVSGVFTINLIEFLFSTVSVKLSGHIQILGNSFDYLKSGSITVNSIDCIKLGDQ